MMVVLSKTNWKVGLKSIVVNLVYSLFAAIAVFVSRRLPIPLEFKFLLGVFALLAVIPLWGKIANSLWGWK